jgi:hypothetical protein
MMTSPDPPKAFPRDFGGQVEEDPDPTGKWLQDGSRGCHFAIPEETNRPKQNVRGHDRGKSSHKRRFLLQGFLIGIAAEFLTNSGFLRHFGEGFRQSQRKDQATRD